MKKYVPLLLFIAALFYAFRVEFIPEIRMLKEAYLIKANYQNNKEEFNSITKDFEAFPNISLNFAENEYIDLYAKGYALHDNELDLNIDSLNENDLIPFLLIDDSSAELHYKNYVYFIENMDFGNSAFHVVTSDNQVFDFNKLWEISYKGFGISKFTQTIYQSSNLDLQTIEEIKTQLRMRNCFGYDRYDGNLILHYRSNKLFMIDAYSYCTLKNPESLPEFLSLSLDYGQLNDSTYWFYNEVWGTISYDPWLVLYNREI